MLVAGLMTTALVADAQSFGLSVTSSVSSVQVSNVVTFNINVTNLTGLSLSDIEVTNQFSASVQFVNFFASPPGTVITNGSTAIFELGSFTNNAVAFLTISVRPTAAGFLTNTVTVTTTNIVAIATTNYVIQATNSGFVNADLGVQLFGPPISVITNDLMTYQLMATNSGPGTVTGATLTNTLPPGVVLKSATVGYTLSQSNLIYTLGILTNGARTNLLFTIQPTNIVTLMLSASIGSASVIDANPTNNFSTTNVPVITYLSGDLVAVTNSAQQYNPQNGYIEQTILLSNAGPSSVASARVVVTGLTNLLANAVGTNSGNPFVYLCNTLDPGQNVSMLLQYYRPTRTTFPFSNSQLQAFEVPLVVFIAPDTATTSTNIILKGPISLPNGNEMIEWDAVTNKAYTIFYSHDISFSNALIAPPSVTAFGTKLQWVDYGPPTTISAPTNTDMRFYRVFQNP
jgi:uncharacterized repeat protein (TIGR01451 family)